MLSQDKFSMVKPAFACKDQVQLNGNPVIEYNCHKAYKSGTIFSQENMLLVVTKGTFNICYGKNGYIVGANQMAFIRNNTLVKYQTVMTEESRQVEFVCLWLPYELVKEFLRLSQLTAPMHADDTEIMVDGAGKNLLQYVASLTVYFDEGLKVSDNLIKVKLLELLFILTTSNHKIMGLLLDLRKRFRTDITRLIEDNITNAISINELAVLAGRSLSSFRRDFLSIYNMPPSQWIREKRLSKAKEYLQTTNMTITDICYTLGFESISHFSRVFKAEFGNSPTAYRSQSVPAA
ncbi:MAG TPA: AraC family transcriptional regulator [Chitinophagaceae bacterium]|nr:AraC family transcriptional regulator [Chitinophagaceae bacterium]